CGSPVDELFTDQREVVSVAQFFVERALFLALFRFFLQALLLVLGALVLALLGDFVNALFFLRGFFLGERLIVLGDQATDRLTIKVHDLVGLDLDRLRLAVPIEFVFFHALHVGVGAAHLVVGFVVLGGLADDLFQVDRRCNGCRGARAGSHGWRRRQHSASTLRHREGAGANEQQGKEPGLHTLRVRRNDGAGS